MTQMFIGLLAVIPDFTAVKFSFGAGGVEVLLEPNAKYILP